MSDENQPNPFSDTLGQIVQAYTRQYAFFQNVGKKIAIEIIGDAFPEWPRDQVEIQAEIVVTDVTEEVEAKISSGAVEWQNDMALKAYWIKTLKWRIRDFIRHYKDRIAIVELDSIEARSDDFANVIKNEYSKHYAIKCIDCLEVISKMSYGGEASKEAKYATAMLTCIQLWTRTNSVDSLRTRIRNQGITFDLNSRELGQRILEITKESKSNHGQLIFRLRKRLVECMNNNCE